MANQHAAHTPRPWWVTDSGIRDAGGYICHTNKAQRYPGQDERYESETAEREANARLIAAAPEMKEALQEAQSALAMLTDPNRIQESRVQVAWATAVAAEVKCRAAIAKATGAAS